MPLVFNTPAVPMTPGCGAAVEPSGCDYDDNPGAARPVRLDLPPLPPTALRKPSAKAFSSQKCVVRAVSPDPSRRLGYARFPWNWQRM